MKKILSLPKKYLAFFILAVAVVFTAGFQVTNLRASGNINGFGWADGVGWLSLNCATGGVNGADICGVSNYGLNYNAGGTITGYAWSDNLGWVQFDGGCPAGTATNVSHPCAARVVNTPAPVLRGFAKITNFFSPGNYCKNPSTGTTNNCGWSNPESAGYISLSGDNDQDTAVAGIQTSTASAPYSVAYNNGALIGYGWNPLIGWMQFTGTPNTPTVSLEPSEGVISTCTTTPITLTWSSANTTSCTGSWSGTTSLPTTGTAVVSGAGTYTVTCNGVVSNAVTITTTADPSSCVVLTGGGTFCSEGSDTVSNMTWTVPASASCTTNWGSDVYSTPGSVTVPVFTDPASIGDTVYFVTCNGTASNTVTVHIDAMGTTSACLDDTDPPVLSLDVPVMCLTNPMEEIQLSYHLDTDATLCTASWDSGLDIPETSASLVPFAPPAAVGVYPYSITCDGSQSNEVTVTVQSAGSIACSGCTDPDATNYLNTTYDACVYTPPGSGCTDPDANNFDPDATVDDGSCVYGPSGSGKPIIEEF